MMRAAIFFLYVAACGGTPAPAGPGSCSTSLDGYVTGSVKCSGELISYESAMNTSTFNLSGGAAGNAALQTCSLLWTGMPAPNTYSPPAVISAAGSVSQMVNGKPHAWIVRFQQKPPPNQPDTGTFQLSLTSTSVITSLEWFAHGSAQLTLVDQDPAMPEPDIQVSADF